MLYGWFETVAYLSLLFVTTVRLLRALKPFDFDRLMVDTHLSFLMTLLFFLLDEYKSGNAIQSINYPFFILVWLGFAIAAVRTPKRELAV